MSNNGGLVFQCVASGKVLDISGASHVSGTNVQQYASNGTAAQRFYLKDGDWKLYAGVSSSRMRLLEYAEQYEGWRYVWGGRDPSVGFDCAGLVMYCANQVWGMGYDLMYTNAERLYSMCTHISAAEAKPGDLVFYRGTYGSSLSQITHVVFYVGNDCMYGAGDPISYQRVDCIHNIKGNRAAYMFARM